MKKYKVYAKILGYVLPSRSFEIAGCKIERMSYKEQQKRRFRPLKGWAVRERKMNYLTFPRGADLRIFKSNFVVSTMLECRGLNEAIGLAERKFNNLIGALMLHMYYWWTNKHPNKRIRFSEYDYQICKVYEIINGEEKELRDLKPVSSGANMCHYPAFTDLIDNFKDQMEEFMSCKEEIFRKSLKYFVNGVRGIHSQLPEEKIFLDLFKSIELVINQLGGKRIKRFKSKAQFAGRKLHLEKEEVDKIKQLWTIRSRGDFAHARKRENYLPPQWPNPSDCDLFVNYFDLISLSQRILVKYFDYIKNKYTVLINPPNSSYLDDRNLTFAVSSNILCTSWDNGHFEIKISERNKRKLSWFIKKEVAKELKVSISQVKILEHQGNKIVLKVF